MEAKKLLLTLFLINLLVLQSCIDYYRDGMNKFAENEYSKALEYFNKLPVEHQRYDDAQIMILKIDSILITHRLEEIRKDSIASVERAIKDSIARSEKAREDSLTRVEAIDLINEYKRRDSVAKYLNRPWKLGYFTDNFGDETGGTFIITTTEGTFSNSATRNSYLFVEFVISKNHSEILLHEYSKNRPVVRFIGTGKIMMRNSQNETISLYTTSDKYFNKEGRLIITFERNLKLIGFLKRSIGNVRVIVEDKYSSSYNFTIDATGFTAEFDKL